MQYIRMSYKDFCFMVNPDSLKLRYSKSLGNKIVPFGIGKGREICTNPTVISGKGCFVGANARQCIRDLSRLFNDKGSGYLFLPDSTPIKAVFSTLDIEYAGCDDKIEYSFEFVQESGDKAPIMDFGYTFAKRDENLFDIANRTNTDVGELFRLNRYKDLFSVNEGDRVWLN